MEEIRKMTDEELAAALEDIEKQLADAHQAVQDLMDSVDAAPEEATDDAEAAADQNLEKSKALEDSLKELRSKKESLVSEIHERKAKKEAARAAVAAGAGKVVEKKENKKMSKTLEEVRSSHEYNVAYAEYIKTRDGKECRALLTDLVSTGTIPVPTMVQDAVETAYDQATLFNKVRKITDVKGTLEIPFEYEASDAVEHVEGAAEADEGTDSLGIITIKPTMLMKWITISEESAALKGEAFLNYINGEITHALAEKIDNKIVATIKAAGTSDTATAVGVAALKPTAIGPETIFSGLAELSSDSVRNATVIMNAKTFFNQVLALKDLQGRPIYNIVSDNGKPVYYINGVEVLFNDSLATGAKAEILVGDLGAVVAHEPLGNGVTYKYDDKTLMTSSMVRVLGEQYVGFGLVRPKSFAKITVTAG